MQRRKFSREFKIEAVRSMGERGVGVAQASRDIDVHENVVRKWVKEFGADPKQRTLITMSRSGEVSFGSAPKNYGIQGDASSSVIGDAAASKRLILSLIWLRVGCCCSRKRARCRSPIQKCNGLGTHRIIPSIAQPRPSSS
jgi:transposase-like protein